VLASSSKPARGDLRRRSVMARQRLEKALKRARR
jgi:hypothetical protein